MSRTSLLLVVAGLTACFGVGDGDEGDTTSAELGAAAAASGRWTLPKDVATRGADTKLTYDDAPRWGKGRCAGRLKSGANELGLFLREEFRAVDSVGGYACRPNTANTAKMSVHGTGRALDVFIPKVSGAADNARGDKVANWLVSHAKEVGVQLVIWDRTIWQANGDNDRAYRGPNPHTDHIHVEVTTEAAAMKTEWFASVGLTAADGGARDGGSPDDEDDRDDGDHDHEDGDDEGEDAGSTTPPPSPPRPVDPPTPTPTPTPPTPTKPPATPAPTPLPAPDTAAPPSPSTADAPQVADEPDDDQPGERDSVAPTSTTEKRERRRPASPDIASSGCAAAGVPAPPPAFFAGAFVAVAAVLVRRRRATRI